MNLDCNPTKFSLVNLQSLYFLFVLIHGSQHAMVECKITFLSLLNEIQYKNYRLCDYYLLERPGWQHKCLFKKINNGSGVMDDSEIFCFSVKFKI